MICMLGGPAAHGGSTDAVERDPSATNQNREVLRKRTAAKPTQAPAPAEPAPPHRWEIRIAPLPLFIRWTTLDLAYRFDRHWSTGPAMVSYAASGPGNMFFPTYQGMALGWQATYYLKSAFDDGWYLGTHAYYESYRSFTSESTDGPVDNVGFRTDADFGFKVSARYFLLMFGAGLEYRAHQRTIQPFSSAGGVSVKQDQESVFLPHLEFKAGFEF